MSEAREAREFGGKMFVMEEAITGDYSLVKAWKADTRGNLVFKGTTQNFNLDMAKAGKICIAEVEEIVEVRLVLPVSYIFSHFSHLFWHQAGEIAPEDVHLPGVYVNMVVQGKDYEKRIERVTEQGGSSAASQVNPMRERIVRRAARKCTSNLRLLVVSGRLFLRDCL